MTGGLGARRPGCNALASAGVKHFDIIPRKKYKRHVEIHAKEAALTRKLPAALVLAAAALLVCLPSAAAGQTGSIAGKIVDKQGQPLPGAYLYVTSSAMIGIANYITSDTGRFGFVGLPPGSFKIIVEMPGFKTATMEGVRVSAGSTVTVEFEMEPSEQEEEFTARRPGAQLDRNSARAAVVLDRELLARLPLPRDFTAVMELAPGLLFEGEAPGPRVSFSGGPYTTTAFVEDGLNVTHPADQRLTNRINVDLLDQVVVETAGHPAAAGTAQGAYVNVIHQSGGSRFQGSFTYSNMNKDLSWSLWSPEEIAQMGGATVPSLKRQDDFSLTFGGPVLGDIAWMFGNLRYRYQTQKAPFRYWTDPLGVRHFVYDLTDKDTSGLFKLTMSVLDKFKGVLEFGSSSVDQSVYEDDVDVLRPESATRKLADEGDFLARGALLYNVGQGTMVDLSFAYTKYKQPLLLNVAAETKPQYYDVDTGYSWGSGSLNDREKAARLRINVAFTRLQDEFLGMPHELVLGGDYETLEYNTSVWKADNLIHNYASGSPYTYGRTISPSSGNDVGYGLVGFWIAAGLEGGLPVDRDVKRLGAFIQDTFKIGDRLSLSGGLRFDHSEASYPATARAASGNPLSVALGQVLIKPELGFNLYGPYNLSPWDKPISWDELSPRAGLSFDVFGRGRTLLKASFAIIPEALGLGYSEDLAPIDPWASHDFLWYDEDADGFADSADTYVLMPYDFRVYRSEYFRQAVDPDLNAPASKEWTAGLEQELLRDFTLSARYIVRRQSNLIGHVVYDPSTGVDWWRTEDAPEGWWVPFSTVVPGTDGYEDVPLTLQLPSTTAPDFFERVENVPELKAEYRSFELTFRKRMSHGWQLFGTFAWNRSTGTASVASRWSAGNSPVLITPNAFLNIAETDRLLQDRPFIARLGGTVRFKWDIYVSFLLKAQSGSPWARTVTVIPPADWAEANGADASPVTVYLESPGSRRYDPWKNLDLRVEKDFVKAGRTVFSASVDLYNVLGDKYWTLDGNDGGTWKPDGEGSSSGERILSETYGTYQPLWGTRVLRFNLSLKF